MPSGETYIVYGDLVLWNCLTPPGGFKQEAVFTDDGVDLLYYKFTIQVIGWVVNFNTSNTVVGALPNNGSTSAGQRQAGMRYAIAPRRNFEYHTGAQVDGNGVINSPGSLTLFCSPILNQAQLLTLAGFDLNNGPKCNYFAVTQVVADNLFRVEAEFEICMLTCNPSQSVTQQKGVLSNRWSVQDVVDVNRMTTRTTSGKLRIAGAVVNPNQFRDWVIPGLQPGFSRVSLDCMITTDAMWLVYTIIDQEIAFSAPAPATSWEFEHIEGAAVAATSAYGEVRIVLRGDRYVDHKKLIAVAASIAQAKLTVGDVNNGCVIIENTVHDRYGDGVNEIMLVAKGMRSRKPGEAVLGLPTKILGKPITQQDLAGIVANYDYRLSRGARTGDPIEVSGPIPIAAAFSAYLQSPCDDNHKMSAVSSSPNPDTPSPTPPTSLSTVEPQAITDDGTNNYFNSSGTTVALYTYYRMESTYDHKAMRVHCPIALVGSLGGGSNPYALTGSQAGSIVLNLAPRLAKRHVVLRAERVGQWPDLPSIPDTYTDGNSITYTLLDTIDTPVEPVYSADGKLIYTIDREYVYAMSRALNANDNMTVGVNPFDKAGQVTKAFDPGIAESSYPLT